MDIFGLFKKKPATSCSCCSKILCLVTMVVVSSIVAIVVNRVMVEASVKKAIKDNPKVIIDSVESFYKNEQSKMREVAAKKAPDVAKRLARTNPYIGNPNGSKVIVEFFDYACGHCKRQSAELDKVIKLNSNVKVVLADLSIMSEHSVTSAQTGIYVSLKDPSKLERYYFELSKKPVNLESIKQVLKTIGLPEDYIKLAARDKQVEQIMQNNFQAAREVGLQGTPALIINGKFVGGMVTANEITAMLK